MDESEIDFRKFCDVELREWNYKLIVLEQVDSS